MPLKHVVAVCSAVLIGTPALATEFAPYKDALFAYGDTTASLDGERYLDVPYSEARDIDQRDEIPERKAHRRYVDLSNVRADQERVADTSAGPIRTRQLGDATDPSVVVLFVHGKNGTADLGMDDWTFGGNFNRLKNLLVNAGGLYVTVDAGTLGSTEADRIGALIEAMPDGSAVILACGSMGGAVCWRLGADPGVAVRLRGLVLLGSSSSFASISSVAPRAGGLPIPILMAHGSRDRVYAQADQKAAFEAARLAEPSRPLRMVSFEGGAHGTPIRMVDWRDTLNWILSQG